MAFKDANTFYQQQDYKAAAEKYEETLAACRGSDSTCTEPRLVAAYFFLGNSYDNQYRPARKGEPNNDAMLTKAIDNYKKSAEVEHDPKIKKLAMEYLVAAYGPDKLNDPSQAEPILRRMIELEPTEPSNYTYLSRIYEENGDYDQAEQLLLKAREVIRAKLVDRDEDDEGRPRRGTRRRLGARRQARRDGGQNQAGSYPRPPRPAKRSIHDDYSLTEKCLPNIRTV